MTAYGYQHKEPADQRYKEAKEKRKRVLDGVRARRKEIYKKFLAQRQRI